MLININPSEVGDHVERDEEIATIETDKVHPLRERGCGDADGPARLMLPSMLLRLVLSKNCSLRRRIP